MKSQPKYHFEPTEEKAAAFCRLMDSTRSRYMAKRHPATFTPWTGADGEHGFVCWWRE